MNPLLDTVEPDAVMVNGSLTTFSLAKRFGNKKLLFAGDKVEALLSECRKQTLLEAADWFQARYFVECDDKDAVIGYAEDELRRMAEGEK